MFKEKEMSYEAPKVEIIEVQVEQGFAASEYGNTINGWEDNGDGGDSFYFD